MEVLLGALVAIGIAQLGVLGQMYRKVAMLETKVDPMWKQYRETRADGGSDTCPELEDSK